MYLENNEQPYDYQNYINNWNKGKIIIDTKGKINYEGKEIDKVKLQDLLLKVSKKESLFARWIFVSLPPYDYGSELERNIKVMIKEIKEFADKYGVTINIGG